MSDPFDKDPDDLLEPDNPASEYEEGTFDTTPAAPEAPSPSSPTEIEYDEVDPELRKIFWKLVLVIKFTLISLTLGVLFLALGDRPTLGTQLLAFSAVLIVYGSYRYRQSKERIESEDFEVERAEPEADSAAENPDSPEKSAAGEGMDKAVDKEDQ